MHSSFVRMLSLIVLLFLLGCGGGSSGGGGSDGPIGQPGPTVETGTIRIQSVLARAVPVQVTTLRLTGFDLTGQVRYGPSSKSKTSTVDFELVPVSVRRIQVEYLAGERVVGIGRTDVALVGGQTTVIDDLDYSDVDAALASLTIEPSVLSLARGTSARLRAVGHYDDGVVLDLSNSVVWTSSNAAVEVDDSGSIAAIDTGNARVTARLGSQSADATVNVTPASLSSIRFEPASVSFPVGARQTVVVRGIFSDGSLQDLTAQASLVVEATSIATLSGTDGGLLARAPGQTRLTATVNGRSTSATVTVTPASLNSLSIEPGTLTLAKGTSSQLTAVGTYSDGRVVDVTESVRWNSADPTTVDISPEGLAHGLKVGSSIVTASFAGRSIQLTVQVDAAVPTSLQVEPAAPLLPLGNSVQLTVTATFSDGLSRDVTADANYLSSDAQVASVTSLTPRGLVQAHTVGEADISTSFGGQTATSRVTVPAPTEGELQVLLRLVNARAVDQVISSYRLSLLQSPLPGGNVQYGPRAFSRGAGAEQTLSWASIPQGTYVLLMEFLDENGTVRGTFRQQVTIVAGEITKVEDPGWQDETLTPPEPQTPDDSKSLVLKPVSGTLRALAYDARRGKVYATNSTNNTVEVYNLAAAAYEPAIAVGPAPWGMDITPDGDRLLVCLSGTNQIASLDLTTTPPAVTTLVVPPATRGTNRPRNIAIASNGKAFFGCVFLGTGSSDFWQLDLATSNFTRRTELRFPTDPLMLSASGDRHSIAIGLSLTSGDSYFYNALTDTVSPVVYSGESATRVNLNRDGSLVEFGTTILNAERRHAFQPDFNQTGGGFAFHPTSPLAYSASTQLQILDTEHWQVLENLTLPATVTGQMVVADATGRRLVAIASGGLLDVSLGSDRPPVLENLGPVVGQVGESVSVHVAARDADGDTVQLSALQLPNGADFDASTGTLRYRPTAATSGLVSATISASDGTTRTSKTYALQAVASGRVTFLPFQGRLSQLVYSPTSKTLYLSNNSEHRVERVSVPELRELPPVPVGPAPVGLDVSADGETLVVCSNRSEYINVVHVASRTVDAILNIREGNVYGDSRPYDVAFTGAGSLVFTADWRGSGFETARSLDLVTGTVSFRNDLQRLSEPSFVSPSRDGKTIAILEGNSSRSDLFVAASGTGNFVQGNMAFSVPTDLQTDATGSRFAILPGPRIVDASATILKTLSGYQRFQFQGENLGLGHKNTSSVDQIRLSDSAVVSSISLPAAASGPMALTDDERTLFVICEGGLAVVNLAPDRVAQRGP